MSSETRSEAQATFAVLGSNSFSGSHFVAHLLRHGHRVLGISRSTEVTGPMKPYSALADERSWTFARADLNHHAAVAKLLTEFEPTHVVNFAAQSMVAQSWEHPQHWYQTNVVSLSLLTQTLMNLGSLERYVHVSTPEVYGSTEGWIKENSNFRPSTPYAISRAAGDQHVMALATQGRLPVTITRAANVYGPGQQPYRIIPRSFVAARTGKRLTLDGGGHSIRSFIHIRDVADATYKAAISGELGATYHLSTDEVVSIRDVVHQVARLAGVNVSALVTDGPERPGKDAAYMLDSSLARNSLGWAPTMSLDQGLRDTLTWVDEHMEELSRMPQDYQHKE